LHATFRLLVLLLGFTVVSGLAGAVRSWSSAPGLLVTLLTVVPYAGLWLLITLRLPHRHADWKALVPGALLFGAGLQVLHLVGVYILAPYAITKQGTYGALGAAAALLLGLFLLSRVAVAGAVLNVTLWERRGAEATHG
jgi:membrane protein